MGDVAVDVAHSRYMAEHIPDARYVELPGPDHLPWIGDVEPLVAEIQELVTGTRPEPEPDRVVATVMFVDAPATSGVDPGPARMRLAEAVGSLVAEFRGDAMVARGDSLGASFDGPARAIHCAEAIVAARERSGVRCRAGLHTGECELHGGQLRGVAVDMAAEILARAAPGEVLVSRTVADLVAGARIGFVDRGSHGLAAVGDSWQLLAIFIRTGRRSSPCPRRRRCCPGARGLLEGSVYAGTVVRMRDAKGLGYLARLLRHPHQGVPRARTGGR